MIEDEAPLAENTCKYLSLSGIKVAAVSGVEEYREFIRENTARMILLTLTWGMGAGTTCAGRYGRRHRFQSSL